MIELCSVNMTHGDKIIRVLIKFLLVHKKIEQINYSKVNIYFKKCIFILFLIIYSHKYNDFFFLFTFLFKHKNN